MLTPVVAIVPALDEEGTIRRVVEEVSVFVDAVLVIDDGSSDRTREWAIDAGAQCISHDENQGVGAAIATGLRHSLQCGARAAVQVDGDGQHVAASIPLLLAALETGADLVIGTRFEQGFRMSVVRRAALRMFSLAVSRRVGHQISDPTSGFRAFSPRAMATLAPIFPTVYLADTVETLYLAAEHGLTVKTVPVEMIARMDGRPYAGPMRSVIYAARMVVITAKYFRAKPGPAASPT